MKGYGEYSVDQLKAMLRERGCKVSGIKKDLVRRLEEDDEKNDRSKGGGVDRHGTNNVSKDNTGSRPAAKKVVALEASDIYLKHYCLEDSDQYSDSEIVRKLFELVWRSKDIRSEKFGTKQRGKKNQCDNENKAERSYDLDLKKRAAEIATSCNETTMCDVTESQWEMLLSPRVFRAFIKLEDDKSYTDRSAHHW